MHKGLLFDLDGVLVDTAKYHYLAWKEIADELGVPFNQQDNERLKGVSRDDSFAIILELGGISMPEEERARYCHQKNEQYLSYIRAMPAEELLPGVRDFMTDARGKGYQISLGSASKNSRLILEQTGITNLFDAIIDGTKVALAKPNPEVFLKGAEALNLASKDCIVFEDAVAGVEAAHRAGMMAVGVGTAQDLPKADWIIPGFSGITVEEIEAHLV